MMIDLRFNRVSKLYRVRKEAEADAGRHPLVRKWQSLRLRKQDFWAVRDVSFEVERGTAVGIIGHNGAGKSTILKLLSNITTPTFGEIVISGRLSALIEVGSGFHPELTGRENIFLSGSILGMRRREITSKLDSIIEFAGLRQFLDVPVKRYSSGMYVRLGFSIAAHLDPDILLLDEVLAVGDAAFQAKCLQRISELKQGGKTIVFVSHDLGAVERLCDRVLLMRQGELVAEGTARDMIAEYQQGVAAFVPSAARADGADRLPRHAAITFLEFYDAEGEQTHSFSTGYPLTARLYYAARRPAADAIFEIFFYSQDGELCCQFTTEFSGAPINLEPGAGVVEFSCPELGLLPGIYYIDATIKGNDWQYRCVTLNVAPGKIVRGAFYQPHQWRVVREQDAEHKPGEEAARNEFASLLES
jgi:ABC-type polysaccharide/polyol phosphate transport system ATPase subunit